MQISKLDLQEPSKLLDDYINRFEKLSSFFAYNYHDNQAYQERLTHLKERDDNRSVLVEYLRAFNEKYQPHQKVIDNIERLRHAEAVVVVAGQQAGLLTGPAYTIHKCLSILKFAEKKEKDLGIPVIPVFWIAGEDHDFDEVNHINVLDGDHNRKHKLKISGAGQDSISRLPIDKEKLVEWVKGAFQAFGETEYTEALLNDVVSKAEKADNMVDFFAAIIHEYFGQYGLILMDSSDPQLRRLESSYFVKMIENSEAIAESVYQQLDLLKTHGYSVALDQKQSSANLFYHDNGERILLERGDHETFINEAKGIQISRSELIEMAKTTPEKLSNNVVTRPLMQESLLPTLAFIGGPGEVAYWSALKGAFETMGMIMPPVLPRIRITMVDEKTKKWLDGKGLTILDALNGNWDQLREKWLDKQHTWDVDQVYEKVRTNVLQAIQPLHSLAKEVNGTFEPLTEKNKRFIDEQLAFMKKAIERELKLKFHVELAKFDRVKAALAPGGHPQERTWSIYHFINYWGPQLIARLMENEDYSFEGKPFLVEL